MHDAFYQVQPLSSAEKISCGDACLWPRAQARIALGGSRLLMGQQFLEHDHGFEVIMPFKLGEQAAVRPQSAKELVVYAPVGLFLGFRAKPDLVKKELVPRKVLDFHKGVVGGKQWLAKILVMS